MGPLPFGIEGVPRSENPFEIQRQGFKRYFAQRRALGEPARAARGVSASS